MQVQTYYSYHQYKKPFKITVNYNSGKVDIQQKNRGDDEYEELMTINVSDLFNGGSSLLLKCTDNKYIFVGSKVFVFNTLKPIKEFQSPMQKGVSSAYAIDTDNNYYLMNSLVVLNYYDGLNENIKGYGDPESYYFSANVIASNDYSWPKRHPIYETHHKVNKLFVGKDSYDMSYETDPATKYDLYTTMIGEMWYSHHDNVIEKLTREKYIEIIEEFGRVAKFGKMNVTMLAIGFFH